MDPWEVLNAAFGDLSWEHTQHKRPITEPDEIYRARVRYQGRDMDVVRTWGRSSTATNHIRWSWSSRLQLDVEPRPLRLSLNPHVISWPKISTGDPAFEKHYRLSGAPADILQGAFDADLRARLVRAAPLSPHVYSDGDAFWLDISVVVEDGRGDPRLVREMADVLLEVASRIVLETDRRHREIEASQGAAAAAAWQQQHAAAVAGIEGRRRDLKLLILAGVFLLVFGTCVLGLVMSLVSTGLFG